MHLRNLFESSMEETWKERKRKKVIDTESVKLSRDSLHVLLSSLRKSFWELRGTDLKREPGMYSLFKIETLNYWLLVI